jgi:diguanylate cyclase (GGDEF)-like protein/PAS domain S-box-containing protein
MTERNSTSPVGARTGAGIPKALHSGRLRSALLALAYAASGLAWIVYSTRAVPDPHAHIGPLAELLRQSGTPFVLFTSLMLYGVLRSRQLRLAAQGEKLRVWRLLEALANSSSDAIYAKDVQGRYLFVNREACRLLGRSKDRILGTYAYAGAAAAALPAAQIAKMASDDQAALQAEQPIQVEATLQTRDGERVYLSTKGALRDLDGNTLGVFDISRDVTNLRREEARWHRWAMAFENIRDGVIITDSRCCIQTVNAAFTTITGYSAFEAVGSPVNLLQSGRHTAEFYGQMWAALRDRGHWQGEVWNRRKSGEIYPQWLTISAVRDASTGENTHYVGVFTDVTRRKDTEAQLERLAHYDPLTQLPNRVLLHERLQQTLLRTQRRGATTAVMVIDLDGFKTVNDSLGHPAGDELLVCVAKRLQARLHADDLLGRLGGDEFLVVLEDCRSPTDVATLADSLLTALAAPVRLSCGLDAYVTASIGISLHPVDGSMGVVELLRDADAAMYRAKEQGRNRFCFYTSNMNAEAVARLEIEAALSRSLERGELLLHYQPKVDALSGRVASAEALLRWHRTDVGLVPPAQFIPVAEQSSLILDIGAWVIDEACRQIRAWMDAGQEVVRVAVNVAARQFAAGDLDQVVAQALQRHRVDAQWLEVEITEGMLITDPNAAIGMLQRLKALGVKLSLDDFGTGYSSLAYLQHFPLDALKIDQSFVRRIGDEPDGAALVDAVIALAHRLHLRVVAEGVETAAQSDYLSQHGCDEMQGYHFGRPASPEALQQLLKRSDPASGETPQPTPCSRAIGRDSFFTLDAASPAARMPRCEAISPSLSASTLFQTAEIWSPPPT